MAGLLEQLRAGTTWAWRRDDLSNYPASAGWTLVYHFKNANAYFDVTASADGDAYAVTVAKATTAALTAGDYDWVALVDDGSESHEIDRGRVSVLPDYSAAETLDGRTWARQMLDAIDACLLNRATTDQLDLIKSAMGDRSIDRAGLMGLRTKIQSEVNREENAERMRQGLGSRNSLLVRFSDV